MTGNILIVDPERTWVHTVQQAMQQKGHTVVAVATAKQARKRIRSEAPDLIIMDAILPDADAYALARTLKRRTATRHLPIIVVTAQANPYEDVQCVLFPLFDCYLSKPADVSELVDQVESILNPRRGNDPTCENEILDLGS
jgi:DNA-binding response OmpR family regulator